VANRAATIIQNKVRIFLRKRRVERFHEAAIVLQTYYRGYKARREVCQLRLQLKYENHLKATVTLQKWIRGYLARKHLLEQKMAALTIQTQWRGHR
jgi:myosin-5